MINTIELHRLTQRYGAWGYGLYAWAETLIQSNGGACSYAELTATVASDLCDDLDRVCAFVKECDLFAIDGDVVTIKRSKRMAGALDPTEDKDFVEVWEAYGKKVGRETAFRAWKRLTKDEKEQAKSHIPHFVLGSSDLQFRPHLSTYLNQRRFLEPVLNRQGEVLYDPNGQTESVVVPLTLEGFQG
jgi:hypothetical protein